jgi:uncharacterized RDD family membrane protein YckC
MSDPRMTSGDPLAGYTTSPPPPGAGGVAPVPPYGTPAAHWELSGWGRRVGAQLIDGFVIVGIGLALLAIVGALTGGGLLIGDTAGAIGFIVGGLLFGAFAIVAAIVYAPLMMAKTNGKTLGRMACGIRVVRANGKPIDFGYAMLREVVVKWLLFNVVAGSVTFGLAWLIDVLWPLGDEQHRALHDMIVDSRVVLD